MKLPISWLKDYVDFDDTVEGLADKLTFSGTEVEGIIRIGSDYCGVVAAEVKAVERHPNADRLSVCEVFDGTDHMQVVCGAPNVAVGGRYPFARIGTELKGGFKIKKSKIRGVESFGMLCAEDELGLSENHEALMELSGDAVAGTPLSEILGSPEVILELEVTPNRPDCLSVLGMAREVAALYDTAVKYPDVSLVEGGAAVESATRVDVLDAERCPRYTARILRNVKIGPSPEWMRKRLEHVGIRPINNVVDITNYVMMECGRPLHAFDQTLLKEGRIVVRTARDGEVIRTLDEAERRLQADMLVIADAAKPVAVAGVMGGAGSEIRDTTETVLLESACFEPDGIRSTSKRLGLSTESSYRFERGTDVGETEWASRRAASLMQHYAGAEIAPGVIDVFPSPPAERNIVCRLSRVNSLLGLRVSMNELLHCFALLGLPVVASDESLCTVKVPTFRVDLEREVDLIEEFARLYGLDNIPELSPSGRIIKGANDLRVRALYACQANLCALGLNEIQNYSLLSPKLLDWFDGGASAEREALPHPISADQSVLRPSLIPQMLDTLGKNHARQTHQAGLYECGKVFLHQADGQSPVEVERLCVGLYGPIGRDRFDRRRPVTPDEMFLWLKGLFERLMEAQHVGGWRMEPLENLFLEKGYAVKILLGDKPIGLLGVVNRPVRGEWRFNEPVGVMELDTSELLVHAFSIREIVTPGVYPPVERDMALVAEASLTHGEILRVIEQAAPKDLEKVELFDLYEGENIGAGKKSMAYSLTYRSWDKTLTDEEANAYHNGVKRALRQALSVEVREG